MGVAPGRPKGKPPHAKLPSGTAQDSTTGKPSHGTTTKPLGTSSRSSSRSNSSSSEKSYAAQQKERDDRAGKSELQKARDLEPLLEAYKLALSSKGLTKARRQDIRDIERALLSQLTEAKDAAEQRYNAFLTAGQNAEMDTGRVLEAGISNTVRERQEAMTQLLTNGAGETDAMRAMLMAARNWQANAGEANRAYYDTMASTNAGITDLSLDTETAMANAWRGAEAEKDLLWKEYYKSRADTHTSSRDIYNQMLAHYRAAEAYDVEPKKGKKKAAKEGMADEANAAAVEMSKSYKQKKLPRWISGYSAGPQLAARQSNSNLASAMTIEPAVKSEGASLRRWEEGA